MLRGGGDDGRELARSWRYWRRPVAPANRGGERVPASDLIDVDWAGRWFQAISPISRRGKTELAKDGVAYVGLKCRCRLVPQAVRAAPRH